LKKNCDNCIVPDKQSLRFGIVVLNEKGCSIREISRRTGVPKSTVYRWLAEEEATAA
jgi:transposase